MIKNMDALSFAQAIIKISEDPELKNNMSKAAVLEQKPYDQKIIVPKIKNKIEDVLNKDRENFENFTKNKKVSIILPSYNYENFIKEAIDSVLRQSYKNWELIIVDDFSMDNSGKSY